MREKNLSFVIMSLLAVCVLTLCGGSARAGQKITVDDDRQQCKNAQYTSIQAAVTAAQPGAEIVVCAGTYTEQVTIPASKNGITLRSEKPLAAIIKAPAVMVSPKAIVRVAGAQDVTIRGFTITGPGGGPCDSIEYGVRVDMGGSATIRDNHITEIHDTPFSGCQNGIGIQVGRVADATTGSANIIKNLIDNYQKNGITISNVGSSADIRDNDITGAGPTATIAQNGIQVSGGATATVGHNDVSQNIYTPQTFVSTGILLFQAGAVTIDHNDVTSNDVNIYAFDTANPVIQFNYTANGTFDGIDLTDGTTGANVSHNTAVSNGFDGIFIDSASTNNSITHNKLLNNAVFDAEDQSVGGGSCGTANTWEHNKCNTDNHGGCLCSSGGGGGDDEGAGSEADTKAAQTTGQSSVAPATTAHVRRPTSPQQ